MLLIYLCQAREATRSILRHLAICLPYVYTHSAYESHFCAMQKVMFQLTLLIYLISVLPPRNQQLVAVALSELLKKMKVERMMFSGNVNKNEKSAKHIPVRVFLKTYLVIFWRPIILTLLKFLTRKHVIKLWVFISSVLF